ncbi:MAG: ATP-binding protein [Bacteroidota bacterium]|jgi:serine/threonine-protein kinase RsbW
MKLYTKPKKRKIYRKTVFEMVCQSNPKEIGCIETFLQQINKKLNLDDGTMYRLLVSCTEAVNNAMIHGNKSDPNKSVTIRCIVEKQSLTIRVKDEGKGFDPKGLKDPREEKNLLKENGRGVFLMRSLMDSITVKQLKFGSVVEMKVKLHKQH